VVGDASPAPFDAPESHPNLPRRGPLALMFAAIVVCGLLGGAIGYGLVNTSCPSFRLPLFTSADSVAERRHAPGSCTA